MSVAHLHTERLGTVDAVVKVLDVDIVVTCSLHLGELDKAVLCCHIVDVNELGVHLIILTCDDIRKRVSRIKRREARNRIMQSLSVKCYIIVEGCVKERARIYDIADLFVFDKLVHLVGLVDRANCSDLSSKSLDCSCSILCRIYLHSDIVKLLSKCYDLKEVVLANADKHADVLIARGCFDLKACRGKSLEDRLVEVLSKSEHLTRRLHLRTEIGVGIGQLFKGEHGNLDRIVRRYLVKSLAKAELCKRCAEHYLCCKIYHRNARYLTDIRNCSGRSGIDLDNVKLVVVNEVLDIYKSLSSEGKCKLLG